jgi:hypothetical protein
MTVPCPTAIVPFGLPLSRRKHGFKTKGRRNTKVGDANEEEQLVVVVVVLKRCGLQQQKLE